MKSTLALIAISFLFLTSCAHHRDVRASADGVHRVVVQTDDKEEGSRDALKQANHFCEERKQSAAIVTEDQKYTGTMDEATYRNSKIAAKVAQAAGGAGYVFGGKNERTAGGIVGVGGGIADGALGNGYTVEMKFKCM